MISCHTLLKWFSMRGNEHWPDKAESIDTSEKFYYPWCRFDNYQELEVVRERSSHRFCCSQLRVYDTLEEKHFQNPLKGDLFFRPRLCCAWLARIDEYIAPGSRENIKGSVPRLPQKRSNFEIKIAHPKRLWQSGTSEKCSIFFKKCIALYTFKNIALCVKWN